MADSTWWSATAKGSLADLCPVLWGADAGAAPRDAAREPLPPGGAPRLCLFHLRRAPVVGSLNFNLLSVFIGCYCHLFLSVANV